MKTSVRRPTLTDPYITLDIRVAHEGVDHDMGVALTTLMFRHSDKNQYIRHMAALAVRRLLHQVCGEKMEAKLREIMTKIADELPPEEMY